MPVRPKINWCKLIYNGKEINPNETMDVPEGETVYVKAEVENIGNETGRCALQVWDSKNWEQLLWKEFDLVDKKILEYSFTMPNHNCAITVYTLYYDYVEKKWKYYDNKG